MSRIKGLVAILGFAVLMVVAAACSQPQSATPNPKVAPVDTPTAVDGGKLLETCPVTEMGPRENPVLVARGIDPIPSGLDAGNHASCTFARPISSVMLELLRDGKSVVQQLIPMAEPTTDIKFPLSETPAQPIGADLDTGGYDHRITAATEDGEAVEVLFNADAIWVLDLASSPKDLARRAMIAAREAYTEAQALPYFGPALVAFEPVEWGEASFGCPKPDVMYAQVVTPGFRLVFEHEGQRHEYHTVRTAPPLWSVKSDLRILRLPSRQFSFLDNSLQPASERLCRPYYWAADRGQRLFLRRRQQLRHQIFARVATRLHA